MKKKNDNSANRKIILILIIIVVLSISLVFAIIKIQENNKTKKENQIIDKAINPILKEYEINDYKITDVFLGSCSILSKEYEKLSNEKKYLLLTRLDNKEIYNQTGDDYLCSSFEIYVNSIDYYYYISSRYAMQDNNKYEVGGLYKKVGNNSPYVVYEER